MQFTVTATQSSTLLDFGFRNDPSYFGFDDVSVVPLAPPQPRLAVGGYLAGGVFEVYVYGQVGQTLTLQASTNLVNWVPLSSTTLTNSAAFVGVDSTAGNYKRRFYRVVVQ